MTYMTRDEKDRRRRERRAQLSRARAAERRRRRAREASANLGRLELAPGSANPAAAVLLGGALGAALALAVGAMFRAEARPAKNPKQGIELEAGAVEVLDANGAHVRVIPDGFEAVE
jgi:hypothetical protein